MSQEERLEKLMQAVDKLAEAFTSLAESVKAMNTGIEMMVKSNEHVGRLRRESYERTLQVMNDERMRPTAPENRG